MAAKKFISATIALAVCVQALGSDIGGSGLAVDAGGAAVFPTYLDDIMSDRLDLSNAKSSPAASTLHLKYVFRFSDSSEQGRFFHGVYQGAGVSLTSFGDRRGIGAPMSVYLFQGAPVWQISRNVSLDYEWNFGASFGWHPSDGLTARNKIIVGSAVNAYINVGAIVRWRLSRNLSLGAGVEFTHFSNGNTSFPNPGVNTAGLRVSATWMFGTDSHGSPSPPPRTEEQQGTRLRDRISYDITGYGAWRRRVYRGGDESVLLKGHFPVAGLSVAPMYEVTRFFRAGVSADFQWDHSSGLRDYHIAGTTTDDIRFRKVPFFRQICGGVGARAELVMPIFSVNAGIGCNLFGPAESQGTYQMLNLRIRATKGLFLNIGYQLLNFHRQNNLMLGIGYTIGGRSRMRSAL